MFDVGGVLIKWKSNDPIFRHIAMKYDVSFTKMKAALLENFAQLEANEIDATTWISSALSKFGKKMDRNDSADALLLDPFRQRAKIRKGTAEVIGSLRRRGFKVYALTNTSSTHLAYMKNAGWLKYFDGFYASCELHCNKPSPLAYKQAMKLMGVRHNKIVFVDDKAENVLGAKRAGIRSTIRFKTLISLRSEIRRILKPTVQTMIGRTTNDFEEHN